MSIQTGRGNVKYSGTIEELRQAIAGEGIRVQNVEKRENLHILRTESGAICNLTPSTGRLVVQGKPDERLTSIINKVVERRAKNQAKQPVTSAVVPTKPKPQKKKIFVVHGHDIVARDQLTLLLHELGLKPFILARSSGDGTTIIEELDKHIRPGAEGAQFGIVLLTPDDVGHSRSAGGKTSRPRARQNVILELGMLIGALGRGNVAVIKKAGDLELPSDIQGVLYAEFHSHVGETASKLAGRLRKAGFDIDAEAILAASNI